MRVKKLVISSVMVAVTSFATIGVVNAGEQCVAAVRALVKWASAQNIPTDKDGAADSMAASAKKNGYTVNSSPAGCSTGNPCVLVYPRTYGSGINSKYGHVAVLKSGADSKGKVTIIDSNGICGGERKECKTTPNFSKASVIHPK